MRAVAALGALGLALLPGAVAGEPAPAATVDAVVVDQVGNPIPGILVRLRDPDSGAVTAHGTTDAGGRAALRVARPGQRVDAEVVAWYVVGIELDAAAGEVRVVLGSRRPEPAMPRLQIAATGDGPSEVVARVFDEAGVPLRGIRVVLFETLRRTAAAAGVTDAAGRIAVRALPGPYRLLVVAPGLRFARVEPRGANTWEIAMGIAAEPAVVRVEEPRNAIGDPDYPSPAERASNRFNGGQNNALPPVRPTVAAVRNSMIAARRRDKDVQRLIDQMGVAVPDAALLAETPYVVRPQPLGEYCFASSHCSQRQGPARCCFAQPNHVAGVCRLNAECAARRDR